MRPNGPGDLLFDVSDITLEISANVNGAFRFAKHWGVKVGRVMWERNVSISVVVCLGVIFDVVKIIII